jgi:Helix-turn-helix domain
MPKAEREEGDPDLTDLFDRFGARLVSPGGAAALLGLSRKTVYTLGQRGRIRVFHSRQKDRWSETGAKWTYIPTIDLARYAEEVGRPFPEKLRRMLEGSLSEAEKERPQRPGA